MHYLTGKHLSRRALLRGAGATLALPLLESMIPAGVARAAEDATPQRFAALYVPHGTILDRWTPADSDALELSPVLRSLEPFKSRLTVVSGLRLESAYGQDASANLHHARSASCWLTCVSPGTGPTPNSLDQLVAEHKGRETRLPSLELSLDDLTSISFRAPNVPLPMESNPQVVFERLFGDGSTPAERAARQRQAASLLDSVAADAAALGRTLPGNDRARLERYLEDVREIERRLGLARNADTDSLEVPAKPERIPADFEAHAKLMFDLLVLAWTADATRVSTVMIAKELNNRVYARSGVTEPFHNLSHHSNIPGNIERFARLNAYHVSTTFAYFLGKLRNTPDGDATLLDRALVLYGSGMSNPNQHEHGPLPIVVAGGASGKRAGARHIRAADGTPLANLHAALLDKLGVPAESFGDSTGMLTI
jgi:hypothetical protein